MESQLQPSDLAGTDPLLTQANLARIRGNWSDSVEMCVRVLRSQPGNAEAHSLLGDVYRDQGALEDAIQWYRLAADLRPAGPDAEKLRRMEQERERRAAATGPVSASIVAGVYDSATGVYSSAPGGTTQLAGLSPRRWLNALTIVSACFLAATVLVLAYLRGAPTGRQDPAARTQQLSTSHPMMPTAETGVTLPSINPNRPTVLPLGEQPKTQAPAHHTGDGLPADHPGVSRTTALPAFGSGGAPASAAAPAGSQQPPHELAPAPVHLVQPLNHPVTASTTEGSAKAQAAAPARTNSGPQPATVRDADAERDPPQQSESSASVERVDLDVAAPAQQGGAGGRNGNTNGDGSPR